MIRKLLYLTETERVILDEIFEQVKTVKVDGATVCRIGLANGVMSALVAKLQDYGVDEDFLCDFAVRLVGAGIFSKVGDRPDVSVGGVLQLQVRREEVDCNLIKERSIMKLDGCAFDRVGVALDNLKYVESLAEFISTALEVPSKHVHAWAGKLVDWGVVKNVAPGGQTARWIPVARGFEQHHFVRDEPVDTNAGKATKAASKPASTVAGTSKPKPEPKPVEVNKVQISGAMVCGILIGVCDRLTKVSADEKEKARGDLALAEARLNEESKRVTEAMQKGEAIDTDAYNRLVAERKKLAEIINRSDNSSLIAMYEVVINDLMTRFATVPEFVEVMTEKGQTALVSVVPSSEPSFFGAVVSKAKPTRPLRRSKTGLSTLEIGIVSLSRARKGKDHWSKMAEIMTLARKVDQSIKDARIVNAFRYEVDGRKSGGAVERRQSNSGESGAQGKRFEYRLTETGRLAADVIEKRLADMKGEVTVAVPRPARKKKGNRKGCARPEMRGVNSQLAKFALCAATGNLKEWFTFNDLCELLRKDFSEIKSVNVCSLLSTECALKGGFFTRRQPTADALAETKNRHKVKFLYKLTDDGRAFAARVADAGSGSADASPKPAARGKKDGKLNLGQRVASAWANTPSYRDKLTVAQVMVLAQAGDPELKSGQISRSLSSGYFCDLFNKLVPTQESGGQAVLYSLTEAGRSMRKGGN